MKKKIIFIMTLIILNTNAFGIVPVAATTGLLPVLKNIFKGTKQVFGAVKSTGLLQVSTSGFGIQASLLTNKVSQVTGQWVPEPFQDNVKNVVGSCLQDLQAKLFKRIKWPSVKVCGHDIIADLRDDIDNYIKEYIVRFNIELFGRSGLITYRKGGEYPEKDIRKTKKDIFNMVSQYANNPASSGINNSIDNINNLNDTLNQAEKREVVYNVLTYNQTLQNIKDISNGLNTLGVNFNSSIVESAGKQIEEDKHIAFQIKDTERLNQEEINLFSNIFEYRKIRNEYLFCFYKCKTKF